MTIREASEIVPDVTRMRVEVAADAEERARADGYAQAEMDIVAWMRKGRLFSADAEEIEAGAHRPKAS